jgi:hypothetical protein
LCHRGHARANYRARPCRASESISHKSSASRMQVSQLRATARKTIKKIFAIFFANPPSEPKSVQLDFGTAQTITPLQLRRTND